MIAFIKLGGEHVGFRIILFFERKHIRFVNKAVKRIILKRLRIYF